MSWCDLDLTFGLSIVTLIFKIGPGPYLRDYEVQEVDTW